MTNYYLNRKYWVGIKGNIDEAIAAEFPGNFKLRRLELEEVTQDQYENTVLDLRYEDGEWQQ